MTRLLLPFLAVTLCTSAALAAPPPGVKVELIPDKAQVMVGEASFATFRVSNKTQAAITLHVEWLARNSLGRPTTFEVSAVSDQGVPVPVPKLGGAFGGKSWHVEIAPGQHHDLRLFLPNWAPFSSPGNYTVRAATSLEFGKEAAATRYDVTARASLEVIAADKTHFGALIKRDAAKMKAGDDEASRRMIHTRDPRVLAVFTDELATQDYTRKFHAIRVLATWNDDRALAGLKRAMKTSAGDLDPDRYTREELRVESAAQLRVSAAYALASSPHPRAGVLLVDLRDDAHPSVRLIVAQNVAKAAPEQAKRVLQKLAEDPAPLVAREAKRILRGL